MITKLTAALTWPLVVLLAAVPLTAAGALAPAPRVVNVRIYNQSSMADAGLATMLDVANRIWAPYGIAVARSDDPDAIAVVIADRQTRETAANPQSAVIGTTLFTQGHATPYINLSLGAAEAFAMSSHDDGPPFSARPRVQRDAMLDRMMGVALAHELAHYLLDTMDHTRAGLLRAGLSLRDFTRPEPSRLTLTLAQRRQLCDLEGLGPH
jgi:hypothetical protein